MALKRNDGEAVYDKKRKRVGFANIDSGVQANECIKVFLVSSPEEIDAASTVCIDLLGIDQFFGEDGKIYGYKDLKINVWLSSISFHAYAEVTFQGTYDGGKGITDLKPALQKIFGETVMEKKEFIQTFSSEVHSVRNIVSSGTVIRCDSSQGRNSTTDTCSDLEDSAFEVIRMDLSCLPVGVLYSRLVPLVLLLVEGSSAVDVTDPRWEIYFVVKKIPDQSGSFLYRLLGFATAYRFYHYPDSARLRISQILVLPPCQGQGHGRCLLESVNSVAISENYYDVTVEEPSDYLQYLRACIDTIRLLNFEPINTAIASAVSYLNEGNLLKRTKKFQLDPPTIVVEAAREKLKINKKHFLRCWEVLIFLKLDPGNKKRMDHFKACVSDRVKGDIIDKDTGTGGKQLVEVPNSYDHDMTFVVFRSQNGEDKPDDLNNDVEEDKAGQEEQLNQLVDERMEEIAEVAQKVLLLSKR